MHQPRHSMPASAHVACSSPSATVYAANTGPGRTPGSQHLAGQEFPLPPLQQRIARAGANVAELASQLLAGLAAKPPSLAPSPPHAQASTWSAPCHWEQGGLGLFGGKDACARNADEQSLTRSGGDTRTISDCSASDQEVTPQIADLPLIGDCVERKGRTTLMIRNIPLMYTREVLIQEWPVCGNYNFLYLPRTGDANLSYAFINFASEAHAEAFRTRWHKMRLAHFSARKPLNVSYADVQGLEANLLEIKKKRVRRMQMRQCEPIVLIDSQQVTYSQALALLFGDRRADTAAPWAGMSSVGTRGRPSECTSDAVGILCARRTPCDNFG